MEEWLGVRLFHRSARSITLTTPEVAWVGLTEEHAKATVRPMEAEGPEPLPRRQLRTGGRRPFQRQLCASPPNRRLPQRKPVHDHSRRRRVALFEQASFIAPAFAMLEHIDSVFVVAEPIREIIQRVRT
jgi:hypothetical protein